MESIDDWEASHLIMLDGLVCATCRETVFPAANRAGMRLARLRRVSTMQRTRMMTTSAAFSFWLVAMVGGIPNSAPTKTSPPSAQAALKGLATALEA